MIPRIASFLFDLTEAGSPPFIVFVVFGMAGQVFSKVCLVELSSHKGSALESEECVSHRDSLDGLVQTWRRAGKDDK